MTGPLQVALDNIADGAAVELFNRALAEVLENIDDPNTAVKPKRKITLTVEFTTDDERRLCVATLACTAKLAPVKPVVTTVGVGRHKGMLVMVESLRQEQMFPDPAGRPAAHVEAQ